MRKIRRRRDCRAAIPLQDPYPPYGDWSSAEAMASFKMSPDFNVRVMPFLVLDLGPLAVLASAGERVLLFLYWEVSILSSMPEELSSEERGTWGALAMAADWAGG